MSEHDEDRSHLEVDSPTPVHVAERVFRESPYPALRKLKCRFDDGQLVILGNVPTFYLKQLAQTVVQQMKLAERVDNRVSVDCAPEVD